MTLVLVGRLYRAAIKHTELRTVMAYYCGTLTHLESDGNSKHRKFNKFLDRCRVILCFVDRASRFNSINTSKKVRQVVY